MSPITFHFVKETLLSITLLQDIHFDHSKLLLNQKLRRLDVKNIMEAIAKIA